MNVLIQILQFYQSYLMALSSRTTDNIPGITALVSVLLGIIPILGYLVYTKHASREVKIGCSCARCWDRRWTVKTIALLGGASSFDFGTGYFFLSLFVQEPIKSVFLGLAVLNLFWTIISTALLVYYMVKDRKAIRAEKGSVFWILAHMLGCGWITASGILFPLFWLQEWAKRKNHATTETFLMRIRDFETLVRWGFSLPFVLILNVVTLPVLRKLTLPGIDWAKE